MSQFTWWRRFWPTQKLSKEQFYTTGSKLLQRIEFGEFEYEPLSEETQLEEELYCLKCEEIDQLKGYHHLTLEEMKIAERKKKNKRVNVMLRHHLDTEQTRLYTLRDELVKEFKLDSKKIWEVIEEFDGTTRELYFYIKSMAYGREPKTSEEIQKIPRLQTEQHRHILKPKHKKHQKTWEKIVQNKELY